MTLRSLLQYRKDPRFVITLPIVIVLITSSIFYLVQRAKDLSPTALSSRLLLFVLWNINVVLILGILFVLLRGVIKLLLERQRGLLGSRFRTKLVATYVATSLVPILLLFFVATDLLRVSIDRWFNTPVRTLLQNSSRIADAAQQNSMAATLSAAGEFADALAAQKSTREEAMAHVRKYHGVQMVGLYRGGALLQLIADPRAPVQEVSDPPDAFFREIDARGNATKIDVTARGKWLRAGVRVGGSGSDVAVAGIFVPNDLSRMIDQNVVAQKNFEQLDSQKETFKASQTSLFLAITLYILFGTLWTAIYVSRRITVPLSALAEGTRTLAEGQLAHRIDVKAADEFALLIQSFNTMAGEIESKRAALTESNSEMQRINRRLTDERAYLSTVLESVSTGIIAVDRERRIRSINAAALRILELPDIAPMQDVNELFSGELAAVGDFFASLQQQRAQRPREITIIRSGELHYLECSASPLEGGGTSGWVVAIEDSTQLVRAQKLAAWNEAARRIAHEIKNPLTPIQLSAERILKKSRNEDPDLAPAVEEGCKTIVREVGQLKRMVDEFSRFARMPAVHLRQTELAPILNEVAALYRAVKPEVTISVKADESLRAVVDAEQIRRALINLVDNAIEATERGTIELLLEKREHSVVLEVSDPGRGVPDADKDKLFLPYFSTKGRGTGLGLAIVHRIVHDHDGRISVHDNQPKGTRFEIELPA